VVTTHTIWSKVFIFYNGNGTTIYACVIYQHIQLFIQTRSVSCVYVCSLRILVLLRKLTLPTQAWKGVELRVLYVHIG